MALPIRKNGFTLIELLVVISIIAILSSAAMVSFSVAQTKGRDGKRKADLKGIQQALEQYYQTNGKYPDTNGGKIQCNTADTTTLDWGRAFICSGITYMAPLPEDPAFDPSTNTDYYYTPLATNQNYMISAKIENSNDLENKGGNPAYVSGTLPCDNATYNGPTSGRTYCVINP